MQRPRDTSDTAEATSLDTNLRTEVGGLDEMAGRAGAMSEAVPLTPVEK